MFLIDEACKPIFDAFDEHPYLVGTALPASMGGRGEYRDVDVRLMLDDDAWRALRILGQHVPAFVSIMIGRYLSEASGLPIDFQIQHAPTANELFKGPRNPLGIRTLRNYVGDAPAPALPDPETVSE